MYFDRGIHIGETVNQFRQDRASAPPANDKIAITVADHRAPMPMA